MESAPPWPAGPGASPPSEPARGSGTGKSVWGRRTLTRYVAVGDGDVAYQVTGTGPDLLFCYGLGSHLELNRQVPDVAEFFDRLSSLFRVIILDRRGTGASDGLPRNAVPTLEEWTEDVAAVLDA